MRSKEREAVPSKPDGDVAGDDDRVVKPSCTFSFVGLLDGPTGAGKSAAIEHIMRRHGASCVVGAKLTTRPRRPTDSDWEFQFVDGIPEHLREFRYSSVGWQYAIDVSEIEHTLESGRSYFTVCTDPTVIRLLRRRFPVIVVYVHRLLSPQEVAVLLETRQIKGPEETRLRSTELEEALSRYAKNIGLYDFVVLNVGGVSNLYKQVDSILSECVDRFADPGPLRVAQDSRGEKE
ncbi:hypothetical protein [Hyalangium versicolor]|uniref:hypothetical protein n=1 Tax=Hyalangium versicolor TaxID=2861190 RepID=UPI001CCEE12F|nr:hypothetical protein [Hyalangium versicolor]